MNFLNLFSNKYKVQEGGIESGFHHVTLDKFQPILLQTRHHKETKTTIAFETALTASSLNLGDAFILDIGTKIYVWRPSKADTNEKYFANVYAQKLQDSRKETEIVVLEEEGEDNFWKVLGGKPTKIKSKEEGLKEVSNKDDISLLSFNFKK